MHTAKTAASLISTQLLWPAPRASPCTLQPRRCLVLDIRTQYLFLSTSDWLDVNPTEREIMTRHRGAAVDSDSDIVPARAGDVLPPHITDAQVRAVAVGVAVDAAADVDGLVDVLYLKVAERDIPDVALARVCLDPGGVGAVHAADVFEDDVVDIIDGVISKRADHSTAALVTSDVANGDIGAVTFDGDAVLGL